MGDVDLFGDPVPDPIDPVPGEPRNAHLNPKRRRRVEIVADRIAAGRHPLTNGPLHPEASRERDRGSPAAPFTCGACVHRQTMGHHTRSYPKCMIPTPGTPVAPPAALPRKRDETLAESVKRITQRSAWFETRYSRVSNGDATDVRAWWPACPAYEPKETPDA